MHLCIRQSDRYLESTCGRLRCVRAPVSERRAQWIINVGRARGHEAAFHIDAAGSVWADAVPNNRERASVQGAGNRPYFNYAGGTRASETLAAVIGTCACDLG